MANVPHDHRELADFTHRPDGQQWDYVVLSKAVRAEGLVRPVRDTYEHRTCGTTTTIADQVAETFAARPGFYGQTFCAECAAHFLLGEFFWVLDGDTVGS